MLLYKLSLVCGDSEFIESARKWRKMLGGDAFIDDCGVCSGGTTELFPNEDVDCSGVCYGSAIIDNCGICSGGTTNNIPNEDDLGCGCFLTGPSNYYADVDNDGFGFGDEQPFCEDPGDGWTSNSDDLEPFCYNQSILDSNVDDCGICFVVEVAGLISLVLGVMGAFKFADIFGIYLSPYFDLDPKIIQTGSFILLFIIIIYTISLLAKMITKTLKVVALGMINRIFGGIFGLLKWGIILSSFVLVTQEINEIITFIPQDRVEQSISYSLLYELGDFLFNWLSNSQIIQEKQIVYQII